jgi:hypothetical protein
MEDTKLRVDTLEKWRAISANDLKEGVVLRIDLSEDLVLPNPHRDPASFMLEEKLQELERSIRSTGQWIGATGRVGNNLPVTQATPQFNGDGIISGLQDSNGNPISFQVIFGHHRLEAAKRCGEPYFLMVLTTADDDRAFRMFARENAEQYGAPVTVKLETTSRAQDVLKGYVDTYPTFADCEKDHPGAFASEASFKNAKSQGVGQKAVLHYLGEGYDGTSVSYLLRFNKLVHEGLISMKDVLKIPSLGVANAFGKLVREMDKKSWPKPLKEIVVQETLKLLSKKDTKIGVASLREATEFMVNQNVNPVKYLKTGATAVMDIHAFLRKQLHDASAEQDCKPEDAQLDIEGFEAEIQAARDSFVEESKPEPASEGETASETKPASETEGETTDETDPLAEDMQSSAINMDHFNEQMDDLGSVQDVSEVPDEGEAEDPRTMVKVVTGNAIDIGVYLKRLGDTEIDFNQDNPKVHAFVKQLATLYSAIEQFAASTVDDDKWESILDEVT